MPPFSSLIIVELHFQNLRHRQSLINLFYCLQGVLSLILHCYCDIVMKNLFFCDYYRNHYGFAISTRLSTTSFMVLYCTTKMNFALCLWERKQTLITTMPFRLFLWTVQQCAVVGCFVSRRNFIQSPCALHCPCHALIIDLLWHALYIPNILCVNKMADSHSKVEN